MFLLPSTIGKFAIELDNSKHNDIDILHQGRTRMKHCGVFKITQSSSKRQKTRTNIKHNEWLTPIM